MNYRIILPDDAKGNNKLGSPVQEYDSSEEFNMPKKESGPWSSFAKNVIRNIAAPAIRTAGAIPSALGSAVEYLNEAQSGAQLNAEMASPERIKEYREAERRVTPVPNLHNLDKSLVNKLGLPEDYLEPKNKFEEVGQGVLESLPYALLPGGGKLTQRLIGTATAALGSNVAKAFGGGPWSQIGGGILSSVLLSKNPASLVRKIPTIKKDAYETAEKLAAPLSFNAAPLEKTLRGLEEIAKEDIDSPLYKTFYRQFLHVTDFLERKIKGGKQLPLSELVKLDKGINDIIFEINPPRAVKDFYFKVKNAISEPLREMAKSHPEWGGAYSTAKNLNIFEKGTKNFQHIFQDKQIFNTVKDLGLPLSALVVGALSSGKMSTASKIYSTLGFGRSLGNVYNQHGGISGIKELYANPATKKLLGELVYDIAQNNKPAIISTLKEIKNISPNDSEDGGEKYRIILPK